LKKPDADEDAQLRLLQSWRDEAVKAGRTITRIAARAVAYAGGFWRPGDRYPPFE
jgi:hypothetical protein